MNKVLLVTALLVLLSLPMFAQEPPVGSWIVGVNAEGAVPVGDFSNASSFGIGGVAMAGYIVDPNLTLSVKAGYLRFSGKDVTVPTFNPYTLQIENTTVSGGSMNLIPILVGGRYYFMPPADMRVYGAVDAGMFSMSNGSSSTKVGVAPALGAKFKAGDKMDVDVHANYSMVFTENTTTSWVGVGIGLLFSLQ